MSYQATPIPTLIPAPPLPAPAGAGVLAAMLDKPHCTVAAADLMAAWVNAKYPEKDPFEFTDQNGKTCTATFTDDVSLLFYQSNLWFTGALACRTCHGTDVKISYAGLDLSSYRGILLGERRPDQLSKGTDILGGGNWDQSVLKRVIITKYMPLGRPQTGPEKGPLIPAGKPR